MKQEAEAGLLSQQKKETGTSRQTQGGAFKPQRETKVETGNAHDDAGSLQSPLEIANCLVRAPLTPEFGALSLPCLPSHVVFRCSVLLKL